MYEYLKKETLNKQTEKERKKEEIKPVPLGSTQVASVLPHIRLWGSFVLLIWGRGAERKSVSDSFCIYRKMYIRVNQIVQESIYFWLNK